MFSPQTIEALIDVVSGGSGMGASDPSIGIYRSARDIERFMGGCGISMRVVGSRLPSLADALRAANEQGNDEALRKVAELSADPRDFRNDAERHATVVAYLNDFLRPDGFELQQQGGRMRLVKAGTSASVVSALSAAAVVLDFDTVRRDLDRATENAVNDPEDAVTAACSIVESVCRSILVELDVPLPAKRDVQNLYRAVRDPLGLDLPPFSGERFDYAAASRSNWTGLMKSSAEWRRTGL
ncbi:hypothetical protein [Aureimonas sp. SA4125]|uniref:hypothetical protein n=1 Tax=Aureimonas sp. SA4125 TaxID=2826993 RepID=UPI001CC76CB5|nr:hypothetical protein [Aureimonas sp. SA4125]